MEGPIMTERMQPSVTAISAVGIAVRDQDQALAFYTEVLGLDKQIDVPLPQLGGRWITVAPPGSTTSIALVPAGGKDP
jgi:lactoylglutathione lyase